MCKNSPTEFHERHVFKNTLLCHITTSQKNGVILIQTYTVFLGLIYSCQVISIIHRLKLWYEDANPNDSLQIKCIGNLITQERKIIQTIFDMIIQIKVICSVKKK